MKDSKDEPEIHPFIIHIYSGGYGTCERHDSGYSPEDFKKPLIDTITKNGSLRPRGSARLKRSPRLGSARLKRSSLLMKRNLTKTVTKD